MGFDALLENYRPTDRLVQFTYPYNLSEPDFKQYINASVTQIFYTANLYHDVLKRLGFVQYTGSFEVNNDGGGGLGNDPVYLNAQDGAGINNANFATPPDGSPARMRMYMWDYASPPRDGSFDAGIVIHEYTHGKITYLPWPIQFHTTGEYGRCLNYGVCR